jgi:hypothetical protein
MADAETKTDAPPAHPLIGAAEQVRASAKWILAAFAAVGVTFAAGLQIASIGSLGGDRTGPLVVTALGLLLTVRAIVVAVYSAPEVLLRRNVSLAVLCSDPDFADERRKVNADPGLLRLFANVDALQRGLAMVVADAEDAFRMYAAARQATLEPNLPDDEKKRRGDAYAQAKSHYQLSTGAMMDVDRIRQEVLVVASFLRVSRAFTNKRRDTAIAAAVAALGICLFAWRANPPNQDSASPGEVLPATPSKVNVLLKNPRS